MDRRPRQLAFWALLLLPMLIVLALVFGIPIADLFLLSFHRMAGLATVSDAFTISNYTDFISDTFFIRILLDTFRLGLTVVACCLVIGYPVAYFVARTRSRWRGVLLFLVISPLLVSTIVRNIGWFPILSDTGLVNWVLLRIGLINEPLKLMSNFTGVVIGLTHALLPFMVLILATVIQRIEPELEEASANLGAGPIETFWRVLLPLSLPGVLSGSLLVLTLAISAYTTPAVLGGNRVLVMAIYIAQRFRTVLDYATGATAAALLMLTAAMLTFLALRLRPGEREGK
jgi:putative spermidine/putrescine transport system permease protein